MAMASGEMRLGTIDKDDLAKDGPPPIKVPEGWKAIWNEHYKEWFYVNIYTKQSQWERPTEPIYPPPASESAVPVPPPAYDDTPRQSGPEKGDRLGSNNPFSPQNTGSASGSGQPNISDDERIARQLQEEENARRGASDSYYNGGPQGAAPNYGGPSHSPGPAGPYDPSQQYGAVSDKGSGRKSGLLGKLLGKAQGKLPIGAGGQGYQGGGGYYPGPHQSQYGYPPQHGYYNQGHGMPYGPHGGHGGFPYGGGYGGGGRRRGMGAGGGAALGLGAGLVGGALIGDAIGDAHEDGYEDGYEDGGGDFGGDDGGGGD
ncbi:hypothetical protein P152DRAFT_480736 [Eremomyces bilateralis CBS 781.70]|uniref:WW domain-containing protein n=1 Tax=Eremomyces bilateralis CBS 781.70 TaxID=1392243 RepID=A0A6G1G978_9PEZI|nr:uncharacterized protein P152DRAFT_480736 [Eremomyces bilateralis CBS 781.70]KAF1814573.1 hypothetical protein P152DRAFT_480736 [Eremomyces bilateralis CBS 781.70]